AKIVSKIHNEKAILLLDTDTEVSIVDTAFARKVGCYIDSSQIQDCVGIGDNVYRTEGRTRTKVTLAGSLVYFFDIWVGDRSGQEAILGMDFIVPGPAVERPEYETPRKILQRPRPTAIKCPKGGSSGDQEVPDHPSLDNPPLDCRPLEVASVASDGSDLSSIADDDFMSHVVTVMKALDDQDPGVSDITTADLPLVEDPAVETD
ncbi:hypothetical protein PHMEG_00040600, partial [Phytophthora megakarya]